MMDEILEIDKKIKEYGLSKEFSHSLKTLGEKKPKSNSECARDTGLIRTFLERFVKHLANKISSKNKIPIQKIKGESEFVSCKKYLKDVGVIDKSEKKVITAVYKLLCARGGSHTLATPFEKYRLSKKITLELIIILLANSRGKIKEKTIREIPVGVNIKELLLILKASNYKHHKFAFMMAFYSGLRITELINLEPRDIDLGKKTLLIRGSKNNKDRFTILPKYFRKEMFELMPLKKICRQRALQDAFKKACEDAGILKNKPTLSFRSLRNGFIYSFLENNVPPPDIGKLTGISMIMMSYYIAGRDKNKEKNPKKIEEKIGEIWNSLYD